MNLFKKLFAYFTSLPETFTSVIIKHQSNPSPFIRRNVCIILEKEFPTSKAAIEIQSEIQSLFNLIQDNVPLVRQ